MQKLNKKIIVIYITTLFLLGGISLTNNSITNSNTVRADLSIVMTNDATGIGATNATLWGTLTNDGGGNCTVGFEYGLSISYGATVLSDNVYRTGDSYSIVVAGLTKNTLYHYRAYVEGTIGYTGSDKTFYTGNTFDPLGVLTVTSQSATGVGITNATLHGTITDSGGLDCLWGFKYGPTASYGTTIYFTEPYVYAGGVGGLIARYWRSNMTEAPRVGPSMEQQTVWDTDNNPMSSTTTYYAQTFTTGNMPVWITSVKLLLWRSGSPGTITVEIRATDTSTPKKPTGSVLTSGTTNGNNLPTGSPYEWREITLTGYMLSASTTYAIQIRQSSTGTTYIRGSADYYNSANPHPWSYGCWGYSMSSGSSWTMDDTADLLFQIVGENRNYGGTIRALVDDATYVYAAGDTVNKVNQYWKTNLTLKAQSVAYSGTIYAMCQDHDYIYIAGANATTAANTRIWQFWKSNMTRKAVYATTYGYVMYALACDDNYLYAGGGTGTTQYPMRFTKSSPSTAGTSFSTNYGGIIYSIAAMDYSYIFVGGATTNVQKRYTKATPSAGATAFSYGYGGTVQAMVTDWSLTGLYVAGATIFKPYIYQASNTATSAVITATSYGGTINAIDEDGYYVYCGGATTNALKRYTKTNWAATPVTATSYGNTIYAVTSNNYDFSTGYQFSYNLVGLTPGNTYHWQAYGENTEGYGNSGDNTFTTIGVITNSATGVEETNATLQGTLYAPGKNSVGFQYGLTTSYGSWYTLPINTWYNSTGTVTTDYQLGGGGTSERSRWAYKFSSFTGQVKTVAWNLKKIGAPTGTLNARIRYVSNDTIIQTQTYNVASLTTSYLWYTFTYTSNYITNKDVYISVEWSGGSASAYVAVGSPNGGGNVYSYQSSAWSYANVNLNIKFNYNYTVSSYSTSVSSLTPGKLYHYRAFANGTSTNYGSDVTFLTKPNAPTSLVINNYGTQQNLSWTHGTGYNRSVVRGKIGSYPTSVTDGTWGYNNTGSTTTHTGLSSGDTWYYCIWEFTIWGVVSKFSDAYAQGYLLVQQKPTVTTLAATGVGITNATLWGYLQDDGGGSTSKIYENYTTGEDNGMSRYGVYWGAQTFTPTSDHMVQGVNISLLGNAPGTITVSIRATDGSGFPTGADLATGTTDGNTLPFMVPAEWRHIVFTTSVGVHNGVKYAIVVRALTGTSSNNFIWREDSSSPTYSGGNREYSSNSGSTWSNDVGSDMMFKIDGWEVDVGFQYGTTTSYGTNTSYQSTIEGSTFSAGISGLSGVMYHYRARAVNIIGTSYGSDMIFSANVYVDDNAAPGWYDATHVHTIREGINNISTGGTVHVWAGTYIENISVNKPVTLIGNGTTTTFVQHGQVNITSDNVDISGIRFNSSAYGGCSTIDNFEDSLFSINHIHIYNCRFTNFSSAIDIEQGGSVNTYINISNNVFIGSGTGVSFYGITLWGSDYLSIYHNTFSNCTNGISTQGDDYANISYNTITDSGDGNAMEFITAAHFGIFNNILLRGAGLGLYLESSDDSIYNNRIIGFNGTGWYGIEIHNSENNLIYNNYFSNKNNAYDDGTNKWNTTKILGTNIIGGSYIGGNYWSNYIGFDANGDGLGDWDVPYNNDGNIATGGDYHPLLFPSGVTNVYVDDNAAPGWYDATHVHTIQEGVNNATSGKTIYVYGGTYREPAGGTAHILIASKTLTIIGERYDMPQISPAMSNATNQYIIDFTGIGYSLTLKYLDISNEWGGATTPVHYGIYVPAQNNLIVDHCVLHDINQVIKCYGNVTFTNNTAYHYKYRVLEGSWSAAKYALHFVCKYNQIYDAVVTGINNEAIKPKYGHWYGDISYNYIAGCRVGIWIDEEGIGPLCKFGGNWTVSHNTIVSRYDPSNPDDIEQAISLTSTSDNFSKIHIRDNLISGCGYYAIHLGMYSVGAPYHDNTTIQNCLFYNYYTYWNDTIMHRARYLNLTNQLYFQWNGTGYSTNIKYGHTAPHTICGWGYNTTAGHLLNIKNCIVSDPLFMNVSGSPATRWALRYGSPAVGTATDGTNIGAWQGTPTEELFVANEYPSNNTYNNPLSVNWHVMVDPDTIFNWTIQCSNGQSASGTGDVGGIKFLPLSGLSPLTTYTVWVNVTNGTKWIRAVYHFTTDKMQPTYPSNFTETDNHLFLYPNSDLRKEWTASGATNHYEAVNTTDSKYVYASAPAVDKFGLTNHTTQTGTITDVVLHVSLKASSIFDYPNWGISNGTAYWWNNGTVGLTASYAWYNTSIGSVSPWSGLPWTWKDIDMLTACIASTGEKTDYCDRLYVDVLYTTLVITDETPIPETAYAHVYSAYLNVFVSNPSNQHMNVSLYWADATYLHTILNVANGTTANLSLSSYILPHPWLAHDTTYYWYVLVQGGTSQTHGELWEIHTSKAWDCDENRVVNYLDVSIVVSSYSTSGFIPGGVPADIIEDGVVNYLDASSVISHYHETY